MMQTAETWPADGPGHWVSQVRTHTLMRFEACESCKRGGGVAGSAAYLCRRMTIFLTFVSNAKINIDFKHVAEAKEVRDKKLKQ